jgi:hypothetical protein
MHFIELQNDLMILLQNTSVREKWYRRQVQKYWICWEKVKLLKTTH